MMHTGTFMRFNAEPECGGQGETLTLAAVARLKDRFTKDQTPNVPISEEEYIVIAEVVDAIERARGYMEISQSPFSNGMKLLNKVVTGNE
jgi:hypothetical protein